MSLRRKILTRALTREVSDSFDRGQTTVELGRPDVGLARQQHRAYCLALETAGLQVVRLPADHDHPDSCFVEDTAVRINAEHLVLTRPGHPSRQGEVSEVAGHLASHFREVTTIQAPGCLDGGDVQRLELEGRPHFLVGLSERTNREGARQFAQAVGGAGASCAEVAVCSGLHLKSSSSFLGSGTVLCVEALQAIYQAMGLNVLLVPEEEGYAANVVRVEGGLLVPAGFPRTLELLRGQGLRLVELEVSEFRKQDGGLTCLSILY